MKTHCARGHELTPDNIVPDRDGSRRCKACKNLARAIMTEKQRATIAEKRKKYNQRNYVGVKSFAAPVTLGSRPSDEVIAEAQRRAEAVPRDLTGMLLDNPREGYSQLDLKLREGSSI